MTETPKTLTLDVAKYEEFLANSDLTDDEKQAFIEALWKLVCAFVDLGFGVHPAQTAMCKSAEKQTLTLEDMVSLEHENT